MIIKALLTLSLSLQMAFAFESQTPLRKYINDYPKPDVTQVYTDFDNLYQAMDQQTAIYNLHFNGPEDDGSANSPKEAWTLEQIEQAKEAQILIQDILQLPPEELNAFTQELMSVYLNEPQSRPAIKQILMAMEALLFNTERLNQLDRAASYKTTISRGGVLGGTLGLGALCLFKISRCSEIVRNNRIIKLLKEGKKPKKAKKLKAEKQEQSLKEMIREVKVANGTAGELKVATIGGELAKESYRKQFAKLSLRERGGALAWFAGFFAAGATVDTLYNKVQAARKDGKIEYELLDPIELERLYFGSLAVVEMTCQVRSQLNKENLDPTEARKFLLNMHSELQILGRITGDVSVLEKKDLNFVTADAENGQIHIDIPALEHYNIQDTRPCPGIQDTGEGVSASLGELSELIGLLADRVAEL